MAAVMGVGAVARCALAGLLGSVGCALGGASESGDGPMLGDTDGTGGTTNAAGGSQGGTATGSDPPTTGMTGPQPTTSNDSTGAACSEPETFYRDDDGDGFGQDDDTLEACDEPAGYADRGGDCDDDDEGVFPGAIESCGGPDTNCDFEAPGLCGSCVQLLASGNADSDGLYQIDPDGEGGALPTLQVYCDMTTDGGGWTLVQRTVWDPVQTAPLTTTFAQWRAVTVGNPAPGQGYRMQGEAWAELNLQLDAMLRLDLRHAADGTSCQPLFYIGTSGELSVTATTALLTGLQADVGMVSSTELTTTDSGPSPSCVLSNNGAPWFYGACCSTCPTYQGGYWTVPRPMANYTATTDFNANTEVEVCNGAVQMALNGSAYRGVNAMEFYLR